MTPDVMAVLSILGMVVLITGLPIGLLLLAIYHARRERADMVEQEVAAIERGLLDGAARDEARIMHESIMHESDCIPITGVVGCSCGAMELSRRASLFNRLYYDNRHKPMAERLAILHEHGFRADDEQLHAFDRPTS